MKRVITILFLALAFISNNAWSSDTEASCFLREKEIKKGKWRTLEKFWNAKGTAFFRAPGGATIKVRYGKILGKDRQKQKLDGSTMMKLSVGSWSVAYARMQIKTERDTRLTYAVCPGGIGLSSPKIRF